MRPRAWRQHAAVAFLIALAVVTVVPNVLVQLLFGASTHSAARFVFDPSAGIVAGGFVFADRRSPLIGAVLLTVIYVTSTGAAANLDPCAYPRILAASRTPFLGALAAVIGGGLTWIADVAYRRSMAERAPQRGGPYR